MGASESTLSSSRPPRPVDQITTVSKRSESVDPILEKLKALKITTPILTSPPTEGSLTDILVRKPSSSSTSDSSQQLEQTVATSTLTSSLPKLEDYNLDVWIGTVNPKVLLELFSMYRDWQEEKAQQISKRQEEVENKIEVADALTIKLLQRFSHSVSAMKTTSQHLSGVHSLQVELGELKGRLTEVISNCDALCKRIAAEGPDSLQASIKPFVFSSESEVSCTSSSLQKDSECNSLQKPS